MIDHGEIDLVEIVRFGECAGIVVEERGSQRTWRPSEVTIS